MVAALHLRCSANPRAGNTVSGPVRLATANERNVRSKVGGQASKQAGRHAGKQASNHADVIRWLGAVVRGICVLTCLRSRYRACSEHIGRRSCGLGEQASAAPQVGGV